MALRGQALIDSIILRQARATAKKHNTLARQRAQQAIKAAPRKEKHAVALKQRSLVADVAKRASAALKKTVEKLAYAKQVQQPYKVATRSARRNVFGGENTPPIDPLLDLERSAANGGVDGAFAHIVALDGVDYGFDIDLDAIAARLLAEHHLGEVLFAGAWYCTDSAHAERWYSTCYSIDAHGRATINFAIPITPTAAQSLGDSLAKQSSEGYDGGIDEDEDEEDDENGTIAFITITLPIRKNTNWVSQSRMKFNKKGNK